MEKTLRLKEARKAVGLTQQQVAEKLGISQNNYSYWENGKVKIDNVSLQRLAELFGVTVDFLLGRDINRILNVAELTEQERMEAQKKVNRILSNVNTDEVEAFKNLVLQISEMNEEELKTLSKFVDFLISSRQ